jgi:hypothetical protein
VKCPHCISLSGILAIGALLMELKELDLNEKSAFFSKYSFIVGETNTDLVTLLLKLEDERIEDFNVPESEIAMDEIDFFEI